MKYLPVNLVPTGTNNGSCLYLLEMISQMQQDINRLNSRITELEKENEKLRAQLRLQAQQLYGSRTESTKKSTQAQASDHRAWVSTQGLQGPPRSKGAQKGHKGHGRKIPENLRVIEQIHELPESERFCKTCGKSFRELSITDDSNEIDYSEEIVLIRHRRKKYQRTCLCPEPKMIASPLPAKLIAKSGFSTNFLVKVLTDKYLIQIPLNRQCYQMRLAGLPISRGTMSGLVASVSEYIRPLYEALAQESRLAWHWHADETRWRVFIEKEGKKSFLWWLWVFASKHVIFYTIDPTRSGKVPRRHLGETPAGIINVDRYKAYQSLGDGIQQAYCWSHVRRDYIRIKTRYPDHKDLYQWAAHWIDRINDLFRLNKARVEALDNDKPADFEPHQKQLLWALEAIRCDSEKEYPHWEQNKAMKSLRKHWDGLTLFVHHPQIPMDNNQAERCLRMPVVGRNNYYGNHSESSGLMTAMMFTIFQTCVHNQLKPDAYLRYYLSQFVENKNITPNIQPFLPHIVKQKAELGEPELKSLLLNPP